MTDEPHTLPRQIHAGAPATVADAAAGNWVDRWAPPRWRPYLQLARIDRPIGTWLLLWPCLWSLALVELSRGRPYPNLWFIALFVIGSVVMRGAGCTYNDIIDRDFDAQVERTRNRPLPSGRVTLAEAQGFMAALLAVGLVVLLQFNLFTVLLGFGSLGLIAIYPFMKRYTNWPQLVLGLTFKWGALLGWAAVKGTLAPTALILYAGCICWTIGYDTIYAHQDKEDDALLGLKSTALHFGEDTASWVAGFYAAAWVLIAVAGFMAGAHLIFFTTLALVALQLTWQVTTLDIANPANCLRRFRSNRDVGAAIFLGLCADMAASSLAGF